jgi:hypothetical protein
MSVQNNPFLEWENGKENRDYRSSETQSSSLTRQMLRQEEYLRVSNRVNPGPYRNTRAKNAPDQEPHNTCNEDIWGWQKWTERDENLTQSSVSSNLLEEGLKGDIPGC